MTTGQRGKRGRLSRRGLISILLVAGCLSGCVYFNTFYNAKQHFKKAEKENRPSDAGRRRVSTSKRLYEDAIIKAQKIVDKHPNSKYYDDALFMIGVCYFRMDDYAKSERRFRELLATHPDSKFSEESNLYLARCRMELGDEHAAFRTFTEIALTAKKKEWRAEAIFQRGEFFADNSMHDSAVVAYRQVFEEYPKSDRVLEARLWAAEQLRLMDRPADALELYEPLIEDEDPLVAYEALLGIAESWYEAKDFDSGIAILEEMSIDPEYADSIGTIRLALGRGLEQAGDLPGAWRQYQQVAAALPLSSWASEAYFRLAEIRQFQEGDLISAKELYDASRREDSRGEWANLALARSANIAKLTEFRRELGRGELASRSRIGGARAYNPYNLPPTEMGIRYSPIAAAEFLADRDIDSSSIFLAGSVSPDGREVEGAPTPESDELLAGDEELALADEPPEDAEEYGPPSDLAPTLGPPVNRKEAEINLIRDEMLKVDMWWSLIGQDSVLGPASPAYLYPFGKGRLLGPVTPSDSLLEYWAALEAQSPARLERERRLEERARRKEVYADIETSVATQIQLAELYRFDLSYPDSAVVEYDNLADQYAGTPFAAQALLAAADTYQSELNDSLAANQRLRRLLSEYPRTDQASDAIVRLGWKNTDADTAHPAWAYRLAEDAFISHSIPEIGLERLKRFIETYPQSRLVPTAEYAIIALTDRHAPPEDSSLIWAYQEITAEYPLSEFATASRARLKTTVDRPQRRQRAAPKQATTELAAADSLTDTTTIGEQLPLAPQPRIVGQFIFPQSEVGTEVGNHVIVYKILIDLLGEISEYEVLQPSPLYDVNEAARAALEPTKFWSDSIAPDSLNIWYRYEMPITPPARELDEFDRLGIDPNDPNRSGRP